MTPRLLALAAALAAGLLAPAALRAATLDFTFSFQNPLAPVHSGRIEGIVRGLTDNAISAARSVEVTFNSDGFGLGEYLGTAIRNAWQVANGQIVGVNLTVFGALNAEIGLGGVTDASLVFRLENGVQEAGLSFSGTMAARGETVVTFTRIPAAPTVVPLPASALLLLGGIGGLAVLRRRRNTTAQAAAGLRP